jgi:hypothetical protein
MLYREIIAVCSQFNIKIVCGQNVGFLSADLVAHKVSSSRISVSHLLLVTAEGSNRTSSWAERNWLACDYGRRHVLTPDLFRILENWRSNLKESSFKIYSRLGCNDV